MTTTHTAKPVKFARGLWQIECTCGWETYGCVFISRSEAIDFGHLHIEALALAQLRTDGVYA